MIRLWKFSITLLAAAVFAGTLTVLPQGPLRSLAAARFGRPAIADPLFVNPENYDFTLRPESPARKLGFRPIEMKGVGPRQPAGPVPEKISP